ncbi:protein FAM161A isoform X2 [Passer domesticus]|uniref:protein FAM161A isoform X2 n=1 Tax=Passer domesticus TaxID=48849 RepID=UPI0030FEFEBF
MEEPHRAARLAASCLRTPLDPRTRAPAALYERGPPPAAAQDGFDLDSNTKREQASPPKRDCDRWIDLSKMYNSNQEYYLKLEELKNAHMETMAKLESMYQNKLCLKGVQALDKRSDTSLKCSRPTWDKSSYQPLNLHKSFSDSDLSDPLGSSVSDVSDEELVFEENGSEAGSSSFAKQQIEKMWDGFCLEDYMSRAKHSLPSSPACRKAKVKAWSPRVTVPKPFQMTIREAQKKEQNVKSKSQIELENHLLKKQLEEEAECQKKFRANPVPATVFLPLYQDIVQRNEERRRSVRDRSKLKLLATQKPFKFIERERQRHEARKMQLKDLSPPENKTKVFRAKPVPRCVYSPDFHDKVKEEELCREIRIRMRAEELLQNSSVPNSRLASKGTNKKKKHKSTEPKQMEHKLKIKSSVPDFELLHEKFQKRLLQQKKVRPLTVCEPFDLCTSYIPSNKDKILKDMQEDEEKLKETRWPFASPRRKPQMGQSGAKPPLLGEGKPKAPKTTESTRRRLQALRNNEKQRRQEYLQELQEMEERVKQMPLLFERVTQKNARIAAEKYYSNRLRALGICPEFVSKKGGAAKSLQFPTAGGVTPSAGRARITKVKMKKMDLFEEAAGGSPQSEQSWEEEEEEEGKGAKTSTPDEQCSDLEDGGEARASPGVLEPQSSWHSDQEEEEEGEEAKAAPSCGHSQEEEEEEAKANLSLGHSEEEEEEEEKAGSSLDHSQEEEEEEEAKAGPSRGHCQEEEEEEEAKAGPSRGHCQEEEEEDECRPRSDGSREEEAQSDPEAEGAFQYEDEEYESDDSEEKASEEEGQ